MKTKGIRIEDSKNEILKVSLSEILQEIKNGNQLQWSILFMDVMGNLGEDVSVPELQAQIRTSETGLLIEWNDLNSLAKKCEQIIDITILGCKNRNLIRRYEEDEEAYENCDIVIKLIDSSYWEIFSQDESFIHRLGSKFKEIEYINSDYLRVYLDRKSKGLRIEDLRNKNQTINLSTILCEIKGEEYYWSILSLNAKGTGEDLTIWNIQQKAKKKYGCFMRWEDLNFFATKLETIINMTILCNKAVSAFKHYDNLQDQCNSCEIVIMRINNSYWEIFSKDAGVIERLSAKFQYVEFLDPNCTDKY